MSFASSMVDRVSPATDEALKQLVCASLELEDAWPVSAEPFSQWVIEDRFAAVRPAFDQVGAVFTHDISLYEQMKLRFLNAGHSIISVLGYLNGQVSVHQALEHASIRNFALAVLHENVLPVATIPQECRGEDYIVDVIKRFDNQSLPYKVQQVNTDSSQKIQQRWFPTIDDALAQDTDTALMSFSVAAWIIYVQTALDARELNDPLGDEFLVLHQQRRQLEPNDLIARMLIIAGADRFVFSGYEPFMMSVSEHYQTLENVDITRALNQLLSRREQAIHA